MEDGVGDSEIVCKMEEEEVRLCMMYMKAMRLCEIWMRRRWECVRGGGKGGGRV